MKTHELKILPKYFNAVADRSKTFEIRKNDRDYQKGDTLVLQEFYPKFEKQLNYYTGREITKQVSYILEGGQYGLEEGYCILGLKDIKSKTKQEFQLGDTAYFIDSDYRFSEGEVYRIELDKGEYYYTSSECDFESKDIGDWVFTSEDYRQMHMENLFGSEEKK